MIRLKRALVAGLMGPAPDPTAVISALQSAVELEHATIPLYLYALYSLNPAKNPAIVEIVQSVVIEEMLHMSLTSNVLNALGGDSQIDQPGFIPTYPGPLPGSVESQLKVHLAPFSMAQLQTFLTIEQPEDPPVYPASVASDEITIGEFYAAIFIALAALGDGAFANPPRNQIGPDLMPECVVVTDVVSAQAALAIIVQQGEGTANSPEEGVGGQVAHYFRFMQIQKGALLVPEPGQTPPWSYTGAPVVFDPTGVYPVQTDPNAPPNAYGAGTIEAFANDNFNYTHTSFLFALDALLSGQNTDAQMNVALGLMMSLKGQAKAMMSGIPDCTVFTGPSFQYQTANPAA